MAEEQSSQLIRREDSGQPSSGYSPGLSESPPSSSMSQSSSSVADGYTQTGSLRAHYIGNEVHCLHRRILRLEVNV